MKKLSIGIAVLILLSSSLIFAQTEEKEEYMMGQMGRGQMQYRMMGHGMMHGMQGMGMMGMEDPLIMQLCHFGCPGFILELNDVLNLSDQQIKNLKTIMTDYEKYATNKRSAIRIEKIELSELLDMAKPDFSEVRNKVDEITAIQKDLRHRFLNIIEKSRNVLSDNQLKNMQTIKLEEDFPVRGRGMMRHEMMRERQK